MKQVGAFRNSGEAAFPKIVGYLLIFTAKHPDYDYLRNN
jgi:hypothetical protein